MPSDVTQRLTNAQQSLRSKAANVQSADGKMGKQDFMNLFLTQMSNQNPVDPMDSGAMMSQLSQLGSMEQLENLNGEMKNLNKTQSGMAGIAAMGYLDRDVLLESEGMNVSKGASAPVYYSLPKDADQLTVLIEDKDGSPIAKQKLGFAPQGRHRFDWDGKDDRGALMPDGKYNISFQANFTDGTSDRLASYNQGRVTGVDYIQGEAWVKAQGRSLPLSKVRSVDNTSARIFDSAKPLPMMRSITPKGAITDEPQAKL